MAGQIQRTRGKDAYRRAAHVGRLRNTVAPAITGTAQVGETLSVADGTWAGPARSFSRQWLRDGAPIPSASGATYELVEGDEGAVIACVVTATANANIAGAGAQVKATSNATAPIEAAA
ncbi:hypothetical protein [Sphingobium baderi]|uniref:Ig-like domain-containing protein n=1 Tax=Sphingobium baderi LL03 TaxID=1114964 RepID=T0HH39_9SPHN|nr:hypothetical protein [Sphingobium baderi]EQA96843.1 hypothetical protein L485_22445 [Sphingobium baderi LL03]KMS64099.1 hypothetical protein V475_20355 [Sphingobium baderi LL03]